MKYDVFIGYNRRDKESVELLASRLADEGGLSIWLDRSRLQPGSSWRAEIETAMNEASAALILWGPHGLGSTQLQERDLAYAIRDARPTFRVIYVLLPGTPMPQGTFANIDTWIQFATSLDEPAVFAGIVAALKGEAPPEALVAELPDEPVPYKGLEAFSIEDARFFFGRRRYVEEIEERLSHHPFLAVLGPSGGGKTSLIQAGFLAQRRTSAALGNLQWRFLSFRPGPQPMRSLSVALAGPSSHNDPLEASDAILARLRSDPTSLPTMVTSLLRDRERLVFVVDRLEELYTLSQAEDDSQAFVSALVTLIEHPHRPALVLVTMRADFYAHIGRFPDLARQIVTHQVYLGPMEEAEVIGAIEAPAAQVGAIFEKGLAAQIRADARARGEIVLPLLQQTLDLLWRKRRGRWLTWDVYREIGGVAGALRYHADRVLQAMTPDEREIARRLFTRLIWLEEGTGTLVGRRIEKGGLVGQFSNPGTAQRVLDRLADERLVVLRSEGEQATAGLVHDTLPLHWDRLREWVQEDREFLLWRQRLRSSLSEWMRTGQDTGTLLRGIPLAEAGRWMKERAGDLNHHEQQFIRNSIELQEQERTKRRHQRRRAVLGLATAAALIIATLSAGLVATRRQTRIAKEQRAKAERRFNDVRKLATSFLFEFHDSIKNLAGATPARRLVAHKALEVLDSLASEAAGDPALQLDLATAYLSLGRVQSSISNPSLGDTEGALRSNRAALRILQELSETNPHDAKLRSQLSVAHEHIGDLLVLRGDTAGGLKSRRKTLAIREELSAADPKNASLRLRLAQAHEKLGSILGNPGYPNNMGDRSGALEHFRKEQAILEKLVAEYPNDQPARTQLPYVYDHIGAMLRDTGDITGALKHHRKAVELTEELCEKDPNDAGLRQNLAYRYEDLGIVFTQTGNATLALEFLRKALAIREAQVAADPKNVTGQEQLAALHGLMGDALVASRNRTAAVRSYREVADIEEALFSVDRTNVNVIANLANALRSVATLSVEIGRDTDARMYMSRLLSLERQSADSPHASFKDLKRYARDLLTCEPKMLRDPARAVVYATRAMEMTKGSDPGVLDTLALAYHMTGEHDRAVTTEEKAISLSGNDATMRREFEGNLEKFRDAWNAQRRRAGHRSS